MPDPLPQAHAGNIQRAYDQRIDQTRELDPDPAQAEAIARLDRLDKALSQFKPSGRGLFSLFRKPAKPEVPAGLYMWGGVGRGKTMLMDLFHEHVDFEPRRRIHFHEFMAEVHDRIGEARKTVEGDPIPHVADQIAKGPTLLCFDELHVTDIADAMILSRLFKTLFANGTVLVATSNARPDQLYKDGLNRQLFLPFIDLLEDHVEILELKSQKDYRLDKLQGHPLYFAPVDETARREMDSHWERLTAHHQPVPMSLEIKGREIEVPRAALGVARFAFEDLCARPLGPRDYLLIAHTFHTVLIDDIPVLRPAQRNEARRFINLIDALYDNKVGLIASAQAEPDDLYAAGDGSDLFVRTASRLMEMRSPTYLEQRGERADIDQPLGV